MKLFPRIHLSFLLIGIAFLMSACVTNPMSWSPDGRWLAFINPSDQKLWIWDSENQKSRRLSDEKIIDCRFIESGKSVLYGVETNSRGDMCDFYKVNLETGSSDLIEKDVWRLIDVSSDGNTFFYIKKPSDQEDSELWSKDLATSNSERLYSCSSSIEWVNADYSGTRFLLTDSETIALYDNPKKTLEPLHRATDQVYFPVWTDRTHYLFFSGKNNDDYGSLYLNSIEQDAPKLLCDNVQIWDLPSLKPDGSEIWVTRMMDNGISQIVSIQTGTGKITPLTTEPLGATWANCDPQWEKVAYISNPGGDDDSSIVHILHLKNQQVQTVWVNEEERTLAIAQTLQQEGNAVLALTAYHDLLNRFPTTRFRNLAWFEILRLQLAPPSLDIDQAFNALNQMEKNNMQANTIFWNETEKNATDPTNDTIAKFGTEASRAKFEFDTDTPRDLTGLSARMSATRLYLKIDYASDKDLSGLTLQDTLILFDNGTPEQGWKSITNQTQWDRGAERSLLLRHWFDHGRESQYDITLRNGVGEIVYHFWASGFAPPNLPNFNYMEIHGDGTGSVVISLDKDSLDFAPHSQVFIQVCTLKGGIESFEKLESPQQPFLNGKIVCDVADAFGEDNSAKRILDDAKQGKPAVIQGFAISIPWN